ncbi:MAG: hypothetical protein DHS20C14_12170 [Phycisphaeraceae bacterium]|nr:MAG: hypothetical protein DHS20C14_12170 [Phycisphaeraceae bacterium]
MRIRLTTTGRRCAGIVGVALAAGALTGCGSTTPKASYTPGSCGTTRVIGHAGEYAGPSLIAGDALAMHTRLAGGYDVAPNSGLTRLAGVTK